MNFAGATLYVEVANAVASKTSIKGPACGFRASAAYLCIGMKFVFPTIGRLLDVTKRALLKRTSKV